MRLALNKAGKLISATEKLDQQQQYFCPRCQKPVKLRVGAQKRAHFAHCSYHVSGEHSGENEEHQQLKKIFATWFAQNATNQVELEQYLPEINQRPDLLINGQLAIEIQCSKISVKEVVKRSQAYHKVGINVIWLCGKKLWVQEKLTDLNRSLLYYQENSGFYWWEVHLEQKKLYLRFSLAELITHQLCSEVIKIPFFTKNLLKVFDLPKLIQKIKPRQYDEPKIISNYKKELTRRLYFKVRKTINLQKLFYQEGRNILELPAYYYHPVVRPLFCADSIIDWKRKLYRQIEQKLPLSEFTVTNKKLKIYQMPLISTKFQLHLFIVKEFIYLKKNGFL